MKNKLSRFMAFTIGMMMLVSGAWASDDVVTVTDVMIDKTAENAVIARQQAMAEAQRLAFSLLAEQILSPEQMELFELPDDLMIASMVQDFEIVSEQIGSKRYVANFTYRFRVPAVEQYFNNYLGSAYQKDMDNVERKTVLMLPFYEDADGQTELWADDNLWLEAWQNSELPQGAVTYLVPLGDISDINAGSMADIWTGDTDAVIRLKQQYRADEVVLAVAARAGMNFQIDIYKLAYDAPKKINTLLIHSGAADDRIVFRQAIMDVTGYLNSEMVEQPKESLPVFSFDLPGQEKRTGSKVSVPSRLEQGVATARTEIEGVLNFSSIADWVELQNRLRRITPEAELSILSLSRDDARFVLKYDGAEQKLQQQLAALGIGFSSPALAVGEGYGAKDMRPVYEVELLETPPTAIGNGFANSDSETGVPQ